MPKKVKFNYFKAYEKLTGLAIKEADLLIETCENFKDLESLSPAMSKMHEYENAGDSINHDIFASAAVDFVPPIDREDIVELAQALDNVLDYIDDVLGHMQIYAIRTMPEDALEFMNLILKSCKALDELAGEFSSFKKNKKVKHLIVDINSYEEEGDKLYKQAELNLHLDYPNTNDIMHVLVWSRIFERMEKCCDAIEHSANIINTIIMKN